MIYYKISFLIVLMISVVCFSVDNPGGEEYFSRLIAEELKEARQIAVEKCLSAMESTFESTNSRKNCIRKAFLSMKLYGDHAFVYNHGVRKYYESFHLYVDYARIRTPSEYCNSNQSCLDQILVFQDTPIHEVHENLTPNPSGYVDLSEAEKNHLGGLVDLSAGEIKIVEEAISYSRLLRGESSSIDIKKNIMMNALYYHVIFDRIKGFQPPEGAARKYFHGSGSHGFRYLADIASRVDLNPSTAGNLASPTQFCDDIYA